MIQSGLLIRSILNILILLLQPRLFWPPSKGNWDTGASIITRTCYCHPEIMLPLEPGLDFQVWGWPEVPLMKNHKAFQEEKFPDTIHKVACIISPCTDLSPSASYLQITLSRGLTCSMAVTNLLCSKKKRGCWGPKAVKSCFAAVAKCLWTLIWTT